MKIKILTFVILFYFSNELFCQSFTLTELIRINNFKFEEFDSYVIKKGYSFYKYDDKTISKDARTYFYSNNNKEYITVCYFDNKEQSTTLQTKNSSTYLKTKEDLKILEYKFIENKVENGSIILVYKKNDISVKLISMPEKDENHNSFTFYIISVKKILYKEN